MIGGLSESMGSSPITGIIWLKLALKLYAMTGLSKEQESSYNNSSSTGEEALEKISIKSQSNEGFRINQTPEAAPVRPSEHSKTNSNGSQINENLALENYARCIHLSLPGLEMDDRSAVRMEPIRIARILFLYLTSTPESINTLFQISLHLVRARPMLIPLVTPYLQIPQYGR
jgi:hypothetical protein